MVLIAEDYTNQHSVIKETLDKTGLEYTICRNTLVELNVSLANHRPDIVILNGSKLGLEGISRLVRDIQSARYKTRVICLCPFEDPWFSERAIDNGASGSIIIPARSKLLETNVMSVLQAELNSPEKMRELIFRKLSELLDDLSFSPRQRGTAYIRDAVLMILFSNMEKINLHGEIYPHIAAAYSTSVKSVEHSIRTAVASCWQKADREALGRLTFSDPPPEKRPTNQEFIMALVRRFSLSVTSSPKETKQE